LNVLLIGAAPIAAPRVRKRLIDWRGYRRYGAARLSMRLID
jgi:hypothetical protein